MDKTRLLLGKPIPFSEGFEVKQPTVEEITMMGEGKFDNYVAPFILTIDALFENEEEAKKIKSEFTLFQLFFHKIDDTKHLLDSVFGGRNALEFIREVLAFFLDIDESAITILSNRKKFAISDNGRELVIDDLAFNKLREIVQKIVSREDVEVERPPKDMTERQKDIWVKLQAGRKRREKRDAMVMADIINIVWMGGRAYIPLNEVMSMTYFQLRKAYGNIISRDNFDLSMGYKLSQKFDVKDDVKHWAKEFKV